MDCDEWPDCPTRAGMTEKSLNEPFMTWQHFTRNAKRIHSTVGLTKFVKVLSNWRPFKSDSIHVIDTIHRGRITSTHMGPVYLCK